MGETPHCAYSTHMGMRKRPSFPKTEVSTSGKFIIIVSAVAHGAPCAVTLDDGPAPGLSGLGPWGCPEWGGGIICLATQGISGDQGRGH